MEKLLKLLEAYTPLLLTYPKWFQLLVVTCICIMAITLVLGIVLFPSASEIRKNQELIGNINVNVSVIQNEFSAWASESDTSLFYEFSKTNDGSEIIPSMGYLNLLQEGGPIKPISDAPVPFDWDFPVLDIKVVNNSEQTIFLTEALFNIEESKLDTSPVLRIKPDNIRTNALHFLLYNEGWGAAKKTLKLNFTSPD